MSEAQVQETTPYILVKKKVTSGDLKGHEFSAWVDLAGHLKDNPTERLNYLVQKYGPGVICQKAVSDLTISARGPMTAKYSEMLEKDSNFPTNPENVTAVLTETMNTWDPSVKKPAFGGSRKKKVTQIDIVNHLSEMQSSMSQEEYQAELQKLLEASMAQAAQAAQK